MINNPKHDVLLILGNLNAVSEVDRSGFEKVVGQFGSGIANDNSLRLLARCSSNGLYCRLLVQVRRHSTLVVVFQ